MPALQIYTTLAGITLQAALGALNVNGYSCYGGLDILSSMFSVSHFAGRANQVNLSNRAINEWPNHGYVDGADRKHELHPLLPRSMKFCHRL